MPGQEQGRVAKLGLREKVASERVLGREEGIGCRYLGKRNGQVQGTAGATDPGGCRCVQGTEGRSQSGGRQVVGRARGPVGSGGDVRFIVGT